MATIGRVHVDGEMLEGPASYAPGRRSSTERTQTHGTLQVGVLLLMSIGFGVALLRDAPLFALGMLLLMLVTTGVMSVAWMRPGSASPEHHPKIDHFLDDSSP